MKSSLFQVFCLAFVGLCLTSVTCGFGYAAPRRVECKNGVCRIVSTVPPAPVADVAEVDRLKRAPSPAPAPADSAPGAPTPADPATRPVETTGEPRVMRSVFVRPVKVASKARGVVRRVLGMCRGCR